MKKTPSKIGLPQWRDSVKIRVTASLMLAVFFAALTARAEADLAPLKILHPLPGTIFPSDIRSPLITWKDANPEDRLWHIRFTFSGSKEASSELSFRSQAKEWQPPRGVWEEIKKRSFESQATLEIYGLTTPDGPPGISARIQFFTSKDPVGAPILFRSVPNPFPDPKDFVKIKWKLGRVSSYSPPITIMEKQTTCFNCHTSSLNGKTFGFEVNKDDRGGYLLFQNPGKIVKWTNQDYFNWNDYRPGLEATAHQATLSAISPDGKYVVSSGVGKMGVDLEPRKIVAYSIQTKGLLLYTSVKNRKLKALSGADNEKLIQGIASSWSPDGKYIYFSRAPLSSQYEELNEHPFDDATKKKLNLLTWRELDRKFPMKYDLYRIPFNGGKGGKATPVKGASANGKSNYYPKASPDGKWIVFTASANGMMLVRPDSDLYIVPASGGEARKLKSSGPGADSWHTWSPNSHWLVFSSKRSYRSRTDLLLTHIDDQGNDSPPILLTQFRDSGGLSNNLPEFLNIKPGQFEKIDPRGIH